jgi:hypothetical protein
MIDNLKRIEMMMQECATDVDNEYGHRDADKLMTDLACTLYERCYDEEKRCVERILAMYTPAAKDKWWYK